MNSETYDVGYALGRHWAIRDATPEQLRQMLALPDGKAWASDQADPAVTLSSLIDPDTSGFMGIGNVPSSSFVAGFIDGAKAASE